jgi:DNA mismatch repair protein MutS
MEQYLALKRQHPDAILFFRLGDFYEMFFEDAELAARLLGLTLTSRNRNDPNPVPLAGVPWHQRDVYVGRLLRHGHKVAICEQLQDPSEAKGIVERGVTEILTPGSLLAEAFLEEGESRFLAAVVWDDETDDEESDPGPTELGFALVEASTGEFLVGEGPIEEGVVELGRHRISEWLIPDGANPPVAVSALLREMGTVTRLPIAEFDPSVARTALSERFAAAQLHKSRRAVSAAAVCTVYLDRVQGGRADQLKPPEWIEPADALLFGEEAGKSLELFEGGSGDGRDTLWGVINRTVSGAGARRLRSWLERPLLEPAAIRARHDALEHLCHEMPMRERLRHGLHHTYDLERLSARLAVGKASPRDLVALRATLALVPEIREALDEPPAALLAGLAERLKPEPELVELLSRALVDEPPITLNEGGLIRPGFDPECDRLRTAARSGKGWIAELETKERRRTGISSLKIGYNKVFGYYLEVTKTHQSRVPDDYERRQTLTSAERYVTPELKRLEGEVLGAEEKLRQAERERFLEVRNGAASSIPTLSETAASLAELDALAALAEVAVVEDFVRPEVNSGDRLRLRGARHPVVERSLGAGRFVPNDVDLDPGARQILLITGPNMAGKSTYLRTVGLLVILAQAGSFVPAREAEIGVCDRIFTRVGAADALALGRSTFMVEMVEVASILSRATPRSLVLLDEVGRGTSTYDGLALAWAVTEDLHRESGPRPRTLFATHYHELTRLGRELGRLVNLHVRVREVGDDVVFLHEVAEGPADRSYGIHVARLAGLPDGVIVRARDILAELESQRAHALPAQHSALDPQLGLFAEEESESRDRLAALAETLEELDPDTLSPLAALSLLADWKARFGTRSRSAKPDPDQED